jgi:hypothetical protein
MTTVLVQYKLREGTTREQALKDQEAAAPRFQGLDGLQTKHFLYHEKNGTGGGFYHWESREKAEAFHNQDFFDRIEKMVGSPPTVTYFETAVLVDNTKGDIRVLAAE